MTEDLGAVFPPIMSAWFAYALVFFRVGGVMAVLPAFGERSVPERIRLILTIAFTLIIAPAVLQNVATPSPLSALYLIATEAISGLLLGLSIRLFFMILQTAGAIIAQATSLSQLFGFGAVDAQPAMGHILLIGGIALAVMLDLHLHVASALIRSYSVLPIGEFAAPNSVASWGIAHISATFMVAFSLSAPFMIASLLYNIALGVINRAMPQLMVAFVGAPAITFGGLVLFLLSAPFILDVWYTRLRLVLGQPFGSP